ncbi:hypothetical protein Bca4012_001835 [Brassica carinata]
MHFMLEDFPQSLQEVFRSLWYKFWICILCLYIRFEKVIDSTLLDSRKTLGRLLKKSSNVFYARRRPTKPSGSLPKSSAQSGTKE